MQIVIRILIKMLLKWADKQFNLPSFHDLRVPNEAEMRKYSDYAALCSEHPIAQNVSGNATENVTGENVNVKDAQNHIRYIIHNALLTKKCTKHILLIRATACAKCCAAK